MTVVIKTYKLCSDFFAVSFIFHRLIFFLQTTCKRQRVVIRFVVAVYVKIILSCWFMSRTPRVLIISDGYYPFCWIFLMHLNFFFVESFHIIVAKLFLQECWLRHARFMFGTSSNIRRIFPVIIFVLIHDIRAQFLSIRIDFE